MTGPLRRVRAGLLGLIVATLSLAAPAASAHPFGDPQTLTLEAAGDRVLARWQVGGLDDLTLLGISLGLLPQDRVLLDGAVVTEPGDAATLAASPKFEAYLLERVRASGADGAPCPIALEDASALAEEGAVLAATCTDAGSVELTATLLTDLHPAYRLLASGPDGQRAQYDVDHPTHTWSLDGSGTVASAEAAAAGTGRSAAVQLSAVLGGLGIFAAGGALLARRRARSTRRSAA